MTRWTLLLPGLVFAAALAVFAIRMQPPAAATAFRCVVAIACLLMAKLFVWVARDGGGFQREERLAAFVSFVAILMGSYAARQAIAEKSFDYQVSFQRRGLEEGSRSLSREILSFVDGRRRLAPVVPRPGTWEDDENRWTAFENETADEYSRRFGARVRTAHDLMSLRNMRDRDLDAFYRGPANDFQITVVAERLAFLAARLEREDGAH
ncbi:MAG TPA: hypothetical protein VH583_18940 [Vicinamibacterales bacterium]|jgi:hypothetical protein